MSRRFLDEAIRGLAKPWLSRIHRYKDAYRGESCYLFGDGVSLKWFDLAKFSDRQAITCALLPFHKEFHKLAVKHCFLIEPWFFYPFLRTPPPSRSWAPNLFQQAYKDVIRENPDKNFLLNLSNLPMVSGNNLAYVFRDIRDPRLPDDYLCRRIECFTGSVRAAIFMAAYFGFDHAYLVGFDYTHMPARALHWYEKGQGIFQDMGNFQQDFFSLAREYIDITTVTLDGGSVVLPHVTYQELTGCAPRFRENTEIVQERFLPVLATWPGYSIY